MIDDAVIPPGSEETIRAMISPADIAPWVWQRVDVTPRAIVARYRHPATDARATLRLTQRVAGAGGLATERFCVQFAVSAVDDDARSLRSALIRAVRAHEGGFAWAPVARPRLPDAATQPLPTPAAPMRHRGAVALADALRVSYGDIAGSLEPALAEDLHGARGRAWDSLREALDAAREGRRGAVSAAVEASVAAEPEGLVVALVGALAHDLAGEPGRAVAVLDALEHRSPRRAPAALKARLGLERRLGWLNEAWRTCERACAAGLDDVALLVAAAETCAVARDDVRADALLARAMARAPDDRVAALQRAPVALRRNDIETARAMRDRVDARTPPPTPADIALELARISLGAGDYDDAARRLEAIVANDPGREVARRDLAALHLWRGDVAAAEAVLRDDGGALRHRGVVRALRGEHAEALRIFDAALRDDPSDAEAHAWRAESLFALGRFAESFDAAHRAGDLSEESTAYGAAQFIRRRAALRMRMNPALPVSSARLLDVFAAGEGEGDARLAAALRAMGGNRGWLATRVDAEGALRRVPTAENPRRESKHALWRFALNADAELAARDFADIRARWPGHAEPWNYEGEMRLFCGEYGAARQCFEAALAPGMPSRWAYIGLLAVHVLEGRPAEGIEALAEGVRRCGPEGPTAFVYRGEAHRLLGDMARARADLTHAVRSAPSRVGAWVNLGLVQRAEGDRAGLDATLNALRRKAPALIEDAAGALGADLDAATEPSRAEDLLRACLSLLRGNRASSTVTWFTPGGALRTALGSASLDDPAAVVAGVLAALPDQSG